MVASDFSMPYPDVVIAVDVIFLFKQAAAFLQHSLPDPRYVPKLDLVLLCYVSGFLVLNEQILEHGLVDGRQLRVLIYPFVEVLAYLILLYLLKLVLDRIEDLLCSRVDVILNYVLKRIL